MGSLWLFLEIKKLSSTRATNAIPLHAWVHYTSHKWTSVLLQNVVQLMLWSWSQLNNNAIIEKWVLWSLTCWGSYYCINKLASMCFFYDFNTWRHMEFTYIPGYMSNHINYKMWDEIIYPFRKFNGTAREFGEWKVISSNTLPGMWLLIHTGINVNQC